MIDRVEELARAFERLPGIGPRQAKRFVFSLLAQGGAERAKMAELIRQLGDDVRQCSSCYRFWSGQGNLCNFCSESSRDGSVLMLVEKDQDLAAVERSGSYKGRYFVLGGVLTLSGKGAIREKELVRTIGVRAKGGLSEIVLALSATSEGEHTADRVRELLAPFRDALRLTILGRGLATGSELEYSDAATLSGALQNRKEA
ncbi:MAG: toprim domain-containing protein [bacterium]